MLNDLRPPWYLPADGSVRTDRAGRRPLLVVGAVATLAAGLLITSLGRGEVASGVGDALYAVLVYLLVAFTAPRARVVVVGLVAWGLCVGIELMQLTGLSASLVASWSPAHYLLGTTFQAVDLVLYAGGVLVAVGLEAAAIVTIALVARRRERRP